MNPQTALRTLTQTGQQFILRDASLILQYLLLAVTHHPDLNTSFRCLLHAVISHQPTWQL